MFVSLFILILWSLLERGLIGIIPHTCIIYFIWMFNHDNFTHQWPSVGHKFLLLELLSLLEKSKKSIDIYLVIDTLTLIKIYVESILGVHLSCLYNVYLQYFLIFITKTSTSPVKMFAMIKATSLETLCSILHLLHVCQGKYFVMLSAWKHVHDVHE